MTRSICIFTAPPPASIPLREGVAIVRNDVVAYLRKTVALIIVFLLLVAIFKHWGYPLLIMTTICGLSPLVFIPGAGTELYRGVGAIVLFGILGAAVVSVTMLPALTISVLEWNDRRRASPVSA